MALQADADLEILLFGFDGCGQKLADAGGIGRHGFFGEDVLAGLHRVFKVNRAETRRRGNDDHVDTGVDHLLVGVEACKNGIIRHLDTVWRGPFEAGNRTFGVVHERIGDGDDLDRAGLGGNRLRGCAGAPAPATNQPDFDRITAGGVCRLGDEGVDHRCAGDHRRGFQNAATRTLCIL